MPEWSTETIEGCLDRMPLGSLPTLPTRDYKQAGSYPVIDQGQTLIGGWTDDDTGLISSGLPVIVFGDHTRAFKYVDFPFVRGAEGTQILKPKAGINPLFFYYACLAVDLPSRGYNRHFTILKEKEIPIPSESEQRDISLVLGMAEKALLLQGSALEISEATKRSVMQALFRHGVGGEAQKDTEIGPMAESWRPRSILELCEIWSGGTPRKSESGYWGGEIPWVSGKDLKLPVLSDAIYHVTADGVDAGSKLAPAGAVLMLVRGMGLAKDLPVAVITRPMAFNQDVKALVSRGEYSGSFLRSAIYIGKDRLLTRIVPSAHGTMTLNLNDIETFLIPCPERDSEAVQIVAMIRAIDAKIDLHREKRRVLEALFRALLHKLVGGEIPVSELDLSSLKAGGLLKAAA